MIISHNLLAMNADRQFNIVNNRQKKNMEKLSSGYRINRAADDAAGLSISEKMRRQIRGLSKGIENTLDGISLCQIADGTLNEVQDMLHRLEELSVKAANGTMAKSDREAVQEEIDQILSEINRVSTTSTFNEQRIFDSREISVSDLGTTQTRTNSVTGYSAINAYIERQEAAESSTMEAYVERQEAAKSSTMEAFVERQEDAEGSAIQAYGATQEAKENTAIQTTSGVSALADTDTVCGAFTVTGGTLGTDFKFENGVLTILTNKAITIRNTNPGAATTNRIVVAASARNANITLAGVNINVSGTNEVAALEIAESNTGNVTITLADGADNTLISGRKCAGLQKNGDASSGKLTINGNTGTLTATGGEGAAGIGGGALKSGSNITINGGKITATGGDGGAGIGGGLGEVVNNELLNGHGINITINGGDVTAEGGLQAAGIGGGKDANGHSITIRGGTVTATGGAGTTLEPHSGGAGIGGGSGGRVGGDSNSILIEGGTVTATGRGLGAGIGGGRSGNSNSIIIRGGTVTATGGDSGGAGIGGGGVQDTTWGGGESNEISISDSTVTAKGGGSGNNKADDIGAGRGSNKRGSIEIEDSLVFVEKEDGTKEGTVYGDVTIDEDLTIDSDTTLNIGEDASLSIGKDATLTNEGTIENDGTIDVWGELVNKGTINNRGTINMWGDIVNDGNFNNDGTIFGGGKRWWIQSGSEAGVGMFVEIGRIDTAALGIRGMDVTTEKHADKAISMISRALERVSSVRSNIGAQQNRLEHTIANEENIVENTTAAESQIRDTDVAKEMLSLSIVNILAQAGISVMAQANSSNDGALMLLQ